MIRLRQGGAQQTVKRRRKDAEKPRMTKDYRAQAERAAARHAKRTLAPGVVIEVEKPNEGTYLLSAPHDDHGAWIAVICDAFGTRSEATAKVFMHRLVGLCQQHYHPNKDGVGGEWCPDEDELNLIVNVIADLKPRNTLEAMQTALAIAVYLMGMKASEKALGDGLGEYFDARTAAIAGKLARTFTSQIESIKRARGRTGTRQTIKVVNEKRVTINYLAYREGGPEFGGQPQAQSPGIASGQSAPDASFPALPSEDEGRESMPVPVREG
jgi:hypothetical protein